MQSDQYLGWLALGLTPGLGPRMAGGLLRDLGSPEAIFNASLTRLEAKRLPVVATWPLGGGAAGSTPSASVKFMTLLPALCPRKR
jgi:hypothetical protein